MPGRAFPTFGTDSNGNQCMFVGENHAANENMLQLAWKMMWIHSHVDAVFVEYYRVGTRPATLGMGTIKRELTANQFMGHRASMHTDVSQLGYQCQRYNIRFEGWNIPNSKPGLMGKILRASPGWNKNASAAVTERAQAIGAQRYIIFGGAAHGALMKPYFTDLPAFLWRGGEFQEYDQFSGGAVRFVLELNQSVGE
jgi:hypothetical protein